MAIPEDPRERGDVPVPDLLEQQEPADPGAVDEDEDLPEFDPDFHPEADPADILEQQHPAPDSDDYPNAADSEL